MTKESASPWWTQLRYIYSMLGPEAGVVSAAVGGFNLSLFVVNQYLPEYLRVLGAAPWIIGLFGSTEIALVLVYPYLDGEVPEWISGRHVLTVAGALASIGMVLWLTAPQLGHYTRVPAWGWIFGGLFLVTAWNTLGLRLPMGIASGSDISHTTTTGITGTAVVRWTALSAGFLFAAFVLAEIGAFVPSFQVLLAIAVSIALAATILQDLFAYPSKEPTGETFEDFYQVLGDIRAFPDGSRSLLVGDTLVRFAHGMVGTFFVTVVTSVLRVEMTILGHHFAPSAFFGVLLAIELGVAAVGGVVSVALMRHVGPVPLVVGNFLITAFFPLFLVTVPSEALIVGTLFASFGLRRATLPIRRALIAEFTDSTSENESKTENDWTLTKSYRLTRGIIVVPSAVLGGALYGIDPRLAFGVASAVGLLGIGALHRTIMLTPRMDRDDRC